MKFFKNHGRTWDGVVLGVLSLSIATSCSCTKKDVVSSANSAKVGEPAGYKIALVSTLGPELPQWNNGADLAIREINNRGGIGGRPIKVVSDDPPPASRIAQELPTRLDKYIHDGVLATIVAASELSIAQPLAAKAQKGSIPSLFVLDGSSKSFSDNGNYVFQTAPSEVIYGETMAKLALVRLKAKKAGIVRDISDAAGVEFSGAFMDKFKQSGGSLVTDASYRAENLDFIPQIDMLIKSKPDVVLFVGDAKAMAAFIKQAGGRGFKAPLLGNTRVTVPGGTTTPILDGTNIHLPAEWDATCAGSIEFVQTFKRAYGMEPTIWAARSYQAVKLITTALGEVKLADDPGAMRQGLRDSLANDRPVNLLCGTTRMNRDRILSGPVAVGSSKAGKFVPETVISP